MSYSNPYLREFHPIFVSILSEMKLPPKQMELEIWDEEAEERHVFEPADVSDVLAQLADDLNGLTVYTERPQYFYGFVETMYEENGLIVNLFPKQGAEKRKVFPKEHRVLLDFEWEGNCHTELIRPGRHYIPIHKKPWLENEGNLDIMVPIGYNILIIKGTPPRQSVDSSDRFEAAFYAHDREGRRVP